MNLRARNGAGRQRVRWTAGGLAGLIVLAAGGCGGPARDDAAARAELRRMVARIDLDTEALAAEVGALAAFVGKLYGEADGILAGVDRSKYRLTPDGALYKAVDDGRAALWVSGVVPVTEEIRRTAYFTEAADPELERIVRARPEVAQAYYNDRNSLNRIYPPFDVLAQYPAKMNIPEFSFYYLADEKHNPERKPVWVNEPYVDPAGRGWMISALAPVYVNGRLEGVPGLDITIGTLTARYLASGSRHFMLLDGRGVIVAADEYLINLLGLPRLKDHKYIETVTSDQYLPDDYNLLKGKSRAVRELGRRILTEGRADARFETAGAAPHLVLAERVRSLGWTALLVLEP